MVHLYKNILHSSFPTISAESKQKECLFFKDVYRTEKMIIQIMEKISVYIQQHSIPIKN